MSIGLYTGIMGRLLSSLFEFRLGEKRFFKVEVNTFIESLTNQFGTIEDIYFKEGITGIGWALEWSVQHQLLKINSDEFLADIDDILYKDTVYSFPHKISKQELVWRANYFYWRGISKNKHQNRYRHLCHRECLFLVLEDIEHIRNNTDTIITDNINDVLFLASYFWLLAKIFMLKDQVIETLFYKLKEEITYKLETVAKINTEEYDTKHLYALIALAEMFTLSSRYTRFTYWEQQGKTYTDKLLGKVNKGKPIDRDYLIELVLYMLLYTYTKEKKLKDIMNNLLSNIPYNKLPNTFYRGKGVVDIIGSLLKSPTHIHDTEDLLLLQITN